MYESFFGFREKPFGVAPDPRYLYFSPTHQEALAHLIYGVSERKGFIVLSGEVGTGKTTLIRALLDRLDQSFQVAYVFNPKLSVTDFFKSICHDFYLRVEGHSKIDYLTTLHGFLTESQRKKKTVTLIVDEAQNLDTPLFEEIRMLTNLETEEEKLLQVVLVGQPELTDQLEQSELWQLKQRVSMRYRLLPLNCQETGEYIRTRMGIADAKRLDCFTERAIKKIYEYSGGVPRLINNICDNALLVGYARDEPIINEETIRESVDDLQLGRASRHQQPVAGDGFERSSFVNRAVTGILFCLVMASTILFNGQWVLRRSPENAVQAVRLERDRKAVKEREHGMLLSESKTGPVRGSPAAEGPRFREQIRRRLQGLAGAETLQTPTTPKRVGARTAITKDGDTIIQIILREFGKVDVQLMEAVQELNPEIEDWYGIHRGKKVWLPLSPPRIEKVWSQPFSG